jgi:hypothetical protein
MLFFNGGIFHDFKKFLFVQFSRKTFRKKGVHLP